MKYVLYLCIEKGACRNLIRKIAKTGEGNNCVSTLNNIFLLAEKKSIRSGRGKRSIIKRKRINLLDV